MTPEHQGLNKGNVGRLIMFLVGIAGPLVKLIDLLTNLL
jgi:hypothetical protein